MTIDDVLAAASVIPVLELPSLDLAAPLAEALAEGGLTVVELTLRTDCALESIAVMKAAGPGLIIGMGTIRARDDVRASLESGADFLVSPGTDPNLLEALSEFGAPALPGVATASEAMGAQAAGFSALKFFPAEAAGGAGYLKSLAGPLPDIRFCPTGGIGADLAPTYLALPNVACVGGSWVATRQQIREREWAAITANAKRAQMIAGKA